MGISALTRRKTLVKKFFASPLTSSHINNFHKDGYFADNNVLNLNTASRPPLLVTIYISVRRREVSVRLTVITDHFSMERGYSGTVYCLHKIALYPDSQNPRLGIIPSIPDSRLGFILWEPSLGLIPWDPRLPRGSQDPRLPWIPWDPRNTVWDSPC